MARMLVLAFAMLLGALPTTRGATPPRDDPVASVEAFLAAFAALEFGRFDDFVCDVRRAAVGDRYDLSKALADVPPSVDVAAFLEGISIDVTDTVVELVHSDGRTATVAVRGRAMFRVGDRAAREFLGQLFVSTGRTSSDELVGRLVPTMLYTMAGDATLAEGEAIDEEVTLVREDGAWLICDESFLVDPGADGGPSDLRVFGTATAVGGGRLLLAGGLGEGGMLASAELLDRESMTFAVTGSLVDAGALRAAVLLPDGRVLVAGGIGSSGSALAAAELYDPRTGTFAATGPMSAGRLGLAMTLLRDGDVLVTGGGVAEDTTDLEAGKELAASVERYLARDGRFVAAGSMSTPRLGHAALGLPDGRVLIAGGSDGLRSLASAELHDPLTGTFLRTGSMSGPRADFAAVTLLDGRVMVSGGVRTSPPSERGDYLASAEVFDHRSETFGVTEPMDSPRRWATATVLADGRVLVTGGVDAVGTLATAEVFDPRTGEFSATGSLLVARYGHAAVLLPDGAVLVMGGANELGGARLVERWDPLTGRFAPANDRM